jgi:hypothetical protein
MTRPRRRALLALAAILIIGPLRAQHITTPKEALGFNLGDDYMVANYTQLETYWKKLESESGRMKLIDIGPTSEGRRQYMAIVTSPANLKQLDRYRDIARRLALAEDLTDDQAHALAREGKAVVWIDGGLHAQETVGSQQLMEMVYQMVSRNDPETLRLLDDVIGLYAIANPDGQEMVANWYMRERDPLKRSLSNLPQLYSKYAGHDDNRDFYASNLPETTNINHQLFLEWFPQMIYDHHQTGPRGAVIFMPPFRDPFNYNFDPLIPLGIDLAGAAMHSRLVAEAKGGSAMRSASNYSTWWNGGLRTIAYFHNMIGILTEIIGDPAPIEIPLVADRQLPTGDLPMPIAPQKWRYRQSIEYEITNNRAILDLASRYRETFLYNIYRMGRDSIEAGSRDHWTITPKRLAPLRAISDQRGSLSPELYEKILHDPKARDPRAYILPSDQPDFPTAAKFVNALLKNGVTVLRSTRAFEAAGKKYAAGSYVVKTAQAFRPHVLDMFEPQDYPDDFAYPGAPPTPPYDIAGWTLAMQMGVRYDRVFEALDGPFAKIPRPVAMPPASITGASNPAGYLISHHINNSFTLVNRLLKAGCDVYWLRQTPDPGEIWVPSSGMALPILKQGAAELGVAVRGVAQPPRGEAFKLKPVRIGLMDQYGGIVSAGWLRWIFEQFEFPYQVVYPQALEAGDANRNFDVLVFPDGATINETKTVPQVRKFVESGGAVMAIGGSTALGVILGLPTENSLHALGSDKFYVPGSLLRASVDPNNPLAYGMPPQVDMFFDNSPEFKLPAGDLKQVVWFSGPQVLESGWAWGQQYLDGATAVLEASLGRGKVFLMGPDIAFRAQPHATFKLLFNGLYYGAATAAVLP